MEALYKLQIDKKNIIERGRTNFKKSPKDRITASYLKTKIEALEQSWNSFLVTHEQIVQTSSASVQTKDSYFTECFYEYVEDLYILFKSEMKEALDKISNNDSSKVIQISNNNNNDSVKLPKISIPKFSGQYSEWPTFKDLFTSLIHNNKSLDNVQRLHYLKGLLSGDAEQLVRHIPVTAVNYDECWCLLNSRYDNKRFLSNCLLKRLMSQGNVSGSSSAVKGLLDTTMECLNGLKNLGVDVSSWDVLIIYIVSAKLDPESRKSWETQISTQEELPKLSQFKEFLEARFRALEFLDVNVSRPRQPVNNNKPNVHHVVSSESNDSSVMSSACAFCNENHKIANCKQFAKESHDKRQNFIQKAGLCFNCFGPFHSVKFCRQLSSCRVCKRKHHSLLHPTVVMKPTVSTSDLVTSVKSAVSTVQASSSEATQNVVSHFSRGSVPNQVLLATALVKVQTRQGSTQLLRVLLDQGSQASFITQAAAQLLGLKKIPARSDISGIGGEGGMVASEYMVSVSIHSHQDPGFNLQVNAHVLSNITSLLPSSKVESCDWPELEAIELADPQYHTPNKIDMLLGAEVYSQVVRDGLIRGPPGSPIAQNTVLGWILFGHVSSTTGTIWCNHVVFHQSEDDGNELLKRFWEIEMPKTNEKILSEEELMCENIFKETTCRDKDGRYIVKLPFKNDDPQCQYGNSRQLALRRFLLLENKFKRNPDLAQRYKEVFQEYKDLGHAERVPDAELRKETAVYLPHHAVVREDRSTTKVRIVFDASMKSVNGSSLNDDLMVGPTLQLPLRHIIMRFRMHPISLCADIIKMYRQVKVATEDSDFQRVLWRDSPESEIEEYKLVTVTFGTSSAPYLAVKTLQQVAVDEGAACPEAAERIKNDFYVDDLMTGFQTVEEGVKICNEMNYILSRGGFQLQKWISSNSEINRAISNERTCDHHISQGEQTSVTKNIRSDEFMKILGLTWNRELDVFKYAVNLPEQQAPVTKRKVISDISRLFDPLGWAAPCVVTSKIFIQKLWLSGLGWDDELTPEFLAEWQAYRSNLLEINRFSIPRWINTTVGDISLEIHGFCDASELAYAAVVYLKVINSQKEIRTCLVTARTKVSPVKQQSIPRLELMGAVLLAELSSEVAEVMKIPNANVHLWTDSSVVLAWLSGYPNRWTTFVGNRVSTILSLFDNNHWAHVKSSQNPGDIASRGITPQELANNRLWLEGPSWLRDEVIEYKRPKSITTTIEQRSSKVHIAVEQSAEDPVWSKYSTLQKLLRVIAFCRRVLRWRVQYREQRYEVFLQYEEIEEARKICLKHVQQEVFKEEISGIRKIGCVKKRSKLKSLCPFIDDEGIMRVSGRLNKANLDMNAKHPIILPHSHHISHLVVDEAHKKTLHGGPILMLSYLRTQYWIIAAKSLVKACVRRCITCRRYAAGNQNQLMGQLPACRVTPARPFKNCGVDFAGPVSMRTSKGRGLQSYKGYICIFVCMVSKAVHLEAISDLSAQGFIAGFKRFVARRGIVSDIWSDNGTNFVGAAKELRQLVKIEKSEVAVEIREWLGNNGTKWHFIPPHAPNFGGLWEAGVKATKNHLIRVVGESKLTYEEMATVLSQIEACLNSRPLSILSDDPNDPTPLTPGHFLVGEPLITVPERNYLEHNIGSLKRWQATQRMVQHFWQRWSSEYLTHLLQRHKWTKQTPEPNLGDIVLVKEDGLSPARWLLGRVMTKHSGDDGITRVVTLKCKDSLIKRPTSKLCILPVTD